MYMLFLKKIYIKTEVLKRLLQPGTPLAVNNSTDPCSTDLFYIRLIIQILMLIISYINYILANYWIHWAFYFWTFHQQNKSKVFHLECFFFSF